MKTQQLIEWLLASPEPALRARVLRELLDRPADDPELLQSRAAIPDSPTAQALLAAMHPDGYWRVKHYRNKEWIGAGVRYADFSTTHFVLSYLAELGFGAHIDQVARAAERYLDLQQSDGDWADVDWPHRHYSCLLGQNLRTFVRLGYRDDPRVQRAIDLLLATERPDDGYLCDMHEGKYATRAVKSCIRGSVKVLLALAELTETWDYPRVQALVGYFLKRGGIYRSGSRTLVNRDMADATFPTTWRASIWEVLYALSRMGYGADERLDDAWAELDTHALPDGSYRLDWTPGKPWAAGVRGERNAWVTLYALLAKKHAGRLEAIRS
ncbi:MAG: prenyltransferase/squalene oxidase repeat-containing protein [Anaerolineae bacterium]